jgi:hypothetical protein
MATFGELLSVADCHLTRVVKTLDHPGIAEQARHPGTVAELARLTVVLTRYADALAGWAGSEPAGDRATREATRRFQENVHRARHILGQPQWAMPTGPDIVWALRATSESLGCGLDLLASHLNTQDPVPSANAMVIAAPDTAQTLLRELGKYAAAAGRLMFHSVPDAKEAATLLADTPTPESIPVPGEATAVEGMTLRGAGERIPPVPGEDFDQLLKGINASVQRLQNLDPRVGTATWRYLATASAITSQLSGHLTGVLAHRLRAIDREEPVASLMRAAQDIRRFSMRWQGIVRSWYSLTGMATARMTSPAAVDAGDLVIRLGRLYYADAAWAPGPRQTMRVVPPEQLIPDLERAGTIGLVALKSIEACNVIAAVHHTAVNDAARLTFTRRGLPAPDRHRRRPPAEIRQFLTRYEGVHHHGKSAAIRLGNALLQIPPTAQTATETALIIRRAAAPHSHESPAALAAQSFPSITAQALRIAARQPARDLSGDPHQLKSSSRSSFQPGS